jgi:folate-binding protein YgfZ
MTVFDELAQHARSEHGHLNDAEARPGVETYKLRHAGWHALNIARIEAGTPVFRVDFGPTNLPAETGVLHDRVSFTKGCYLGQEVVARMHSLGHPKQTLAALRITRSTTAADGTPDMPMTGSTIFPAPEGPDETDDAARTPADDAKPVGAVTSATRSPMLGDEPVCFAMLKWKHHEPGTPLLVQTGSGFALATVNDGLRLWGR